jgi:ABC-type sugar transport system ATPase subunit
MCRRRIDIAMSSRTATYPHMTVAENMSFAASERYPKAEIKT